VGEDVEKGRHQDALADASRVFFKGLRQFLQVQDMGCHAAASRVRAGLDCESEALAQAFRVFVRQAGEYRARGACRAQPAGFLLGVKG
jgi:hypothetical protein